MVRQRNCLGMRRLVLFVWGCVCIATLHPLVVAQESSLFHQPPPMRPMTMLPTQSTPMASGSRQGEVPQAIINQPTAGQAMLNNSLQAASWTYTPTQSARVLRLHDIVFIRVDELASSNAQGNASSRKTSLYDANLLDWVKFEGLSLKPAAMEDGDPRVQGQQNEVYRATSQLQTREQMTFNIACTIEDIRPNGTIVLSGQKTIVNNDNTFEFALSGLCRSDDIGPDNSIMSRHIDQLKVTKVDRGHVRDAYSRGWFTRLLARFKPF